MTSDVELLAIEIETLWDRDARGRLVRARHRDSDNAPLVVIGAAPGGGCVAAFGSRVPDALASEIEQTVAGAPADVASSSRPVALERCSEVLREHSNGLEVSSGPSYVVPAGTRCDSNVAIVRSSDQSGRPRERIPEGSGWREDEWDDLLDGKLGPWAMAIVGERVVSICHSARMSDRGAEAGTRTDPSSRGRGYAAATTAAWSGLFAGSGKTLFYSTDGNNRSSQRVAERLSLPLIGWLWKLAPRSS
jgi:hypothetical protein